MTCPGHPYSLIFRVRKATDRPARKRRRGSVEVARDDPVRAAAYRKSFSYYNLQRLLVSIVFYASASMLFLGAFVMRYRLELILAFPLIALVMAVYLGLAFKPESAVVNPEKLYREPVLMGAVVACAVALILLMVVDIPVLDTILKPTGLQIRG